MIENPSKPRLTWRGVLIAAGMWMLYTLLYAIPVSQSGMIPYLTAVGSMGLSSTFLAAYSVPFWYLVIRRMDGVAWPWIILAHAVLAPTYAVLWFESYIASFRWIYGPEILRMSQMVENRVWMESSSMMLYLFQFAVFHVVRSIQRLRDKERQAAEMEALAREMEVAALKAQINPHFLFNTLNSISAMVTRDPEETRRMISRLAELLRYALDCSGRDLVTLRDELHFVRTYLEIESQRYGDRLQVEEVVASEVLDVAVPPMILQPLVENAVRHGIAPSEKGGKITLTIAPEDGRLVVSVEDTGVGIDRGRMEQLTQNGVGLKNTDARLRQLFGSEAGLQLQPIEPHGCRVRFVIPLNRVEEKR